MTGADHILAVSSLIVAFVAWFAATFKSRLVYFSVWSLLKDSGKYEVDSTKVGIFAIYVAVGLVCSVLYALIFTQDIKLVAMFSIFNILFIAYSLMYFVLLRQKGGVNKENRTRNNNWKNPS